MSLPEINTDSYLPNWTKHYSTYDMTVDNLLIINRYRHFKPSDRSMAISALRDHVASVMRIAHQPIAEILYKAYPGDDEKPTAETLDKYLSDACLRLGDVQPHYLPCMRYMLVMCRDIAREIKDIADWSRKDRANGFGNAGTFYYTLFSLITGRWTCGDNSYLQDDVEAAFPIVGNALGKNWENLFTDGQLDERKVVRLFADPCLWLEWDKRACHEMTVFRTVERLLTFECYEKNGNYEYSEEGYYYPRSNYSLPVYSRMAGRLHFHNFVLKKSFIEDLKSRRNS